MIDTHAHYYGEALFGRLSRRDAVPRVERDGGGGSGGDARRYMVTPTSRFKIQGGFVDLAERLAWMDAQGITRQVITFPGALGPDVLPAVEAVPLVRDVNDELAMVCHVRPARFTGLAGLPLADLDASILELERTRGQGLAGFILPSNYAMTLGHLAMLDPLFEAADRLGAHVMLHPGQRADESLAPRSYADLGMHRASSVDLHSGIAHALLSVIHARLPERFPGMSIQVVNLGGSFPVLVERMDHIVVTRDPGAPRPSAMLGGIWVDNASLGPRALELAVSVFGADRVMLGTDYPIFATDVATRAVAEAHLPDGARAAISAGNAAVLLARFVQPISA